MARATLSYKRAKKVAHSGHPEIRASKSRPGAVLGAPNRKACLRLPAAMAGRIRYYNPDPAAYGNATRDIVDRLLLDNAMDEVCWTA